MNEQRRQAIIRLVLPAAGILAVYVWLFGVPKWAELGEVEEKLETAKIQPGESDEARLAQRQLQLVVARKNDLTADERALLRRLGGGDGASSPDAQPATQVVRELTELVTAHDLRVLEDGELERGKGYLPAYLKPHEALTDKAKREARSSRSSASSDVAAKSTARLWRIEFTGAYGDVRRLLDALDDADLPVVPMSLHMADAAADSSARRWTLLVWI